MIQKNTVFLQKFSKNTLNYRKITVLKIVKISSERENYLLHLRSISEFWEVQYY